MLSEAILVLEHLRPVAKVIPGVGSLMEGIIETVVQLAKTAESVSSLKSDWRALAEHAAMATTALVCGLHSSSKIAGDNDSLLLDVSVLLSVLEQCEHTAKAEIATRGLKRFLSLARSRTELAKCQSALNDAVVIFGIQSQILTRSVLLGLLEAVENQTSTIAMGQSLRQKTEEAGDDGEYRLFLWCDFEICERYKDEEGNMTVYRAKERCTSVTYTLKRHAPNDTGALKFLKLLKEQPHPNLEQLIGYSRAGASRPFYVLDTGNMTIIDAVQQLSHRHKIKLWTDIWLQRDQLRDLLSFCGESLGGCWYSNGFAGTLVYCNKDMTPSKSYTYLGRMSSNGRLLFSLQHAAQETHNGKLPGVQSLYGAGFFDRLLPRRLEFPTVLARWLDLLDNVPYAKIHCSHLPYPPCKWKDTCAAVFRGPEFEEIVHSQPVLRGEWLFLSSHIGSEYEKLHDVQPDSVDDGNLRFYIPTFDRKFEWHMSDLVVYHRWNAWQLLAQNMREIATTECVGCEDVAVVSVASRYMRIGLCPMSHLNTISGLFFFRYPSVAIGPQHIAGGYFASDSAGMTTSEIVSCHWVEVGHGTSGWNILFDLNGIKLYMTCETFIYHARFSPEEVTMVLEGSKCGTLF